MLSKLALHYYRPDFSEGQAKQLIADFVADLSEFPVSEVEAAIRAYRRDPGNQFFPKPGQLIGLINDARGPAQSPRSAMTDRKIPDDTRPILWWSMSRKLWKAHWREDEIPGEYRRRG